MSTKENDVDKDEKILKSGDPNKKITERIDKAEMERVLERCEDTMDNFCHDGFSWDIGHNPPGENAVILNVGRIENK